MTRLFSAICLIAFFIITSGCGKENAEKVKSLKESVEVIRDTYGVPHIYADNVEDLIFMEGYTCAQDRFFQMDYYRKMIEGRLSEWFGEKGYLLDRAVRVLGLRQSAVETANWYRKNEPDIYRLVESYSAGVNAYIKRMLNGNEEIPPEYNKIDPYYQPEPWKPEDSFSMAKGIIFMLGTFNQLPAELAISFLSGLFPKTISDLLIYKPLKNTFIVGSFGMKTSSLEPAFAGSSLFTIPASGKKMSNITSIKDIPDQIKKLFQMLTGKTTLPSIFSCTSCGSNSWVISGKYTESGYPMLANDPHLFISIPSNFWEVHLVAPDINAYGISFPGVPGLIIGFNEHVAWGLTTVEADVLDFYSEKVDNPFDPHYVWFNGKKVPVEVRDETILVRKGTQSPAEFVKIPLRVHIVPHHGPIINDIVPLLSNLMGTLSFAWTGNGVTTEMTTYLSNFRAKNIDEFRASVSHYQSGPQNFMYADTEGNIGYFPYALYPIRGCDMEMYPPVKIFPGTGECEWTGFIPQDKIPQAINPSEGFIFSANNDPSGATADGDPFNDEYYISALFSPGLRASRIYDLIMSLKDTTPFNFETMHKMQADVRVSLAEFFIPVIQEAANSRPDLVSSHGITEPVDILTSWDMSASITSPGATLFHLWYWYAIKNAFKDDLPVSFIFDMFAEFAEISARPLIFLLQGGTPPSGRDYLGEPRFEFVLKCMKDAANFIKNFCANSGQCSPDNPATWKWELFHTVYFKHLYFEDLSPGEFPNDGGIMVLDASDSTALKGGDISPPPYAQIRGPNMRIIVEMVPGKIRARNVLAGGESGLPSSPHYDDQIPLWLNNDKNDVWSSTKEIPFYRQDVEASEESRKIYPSGFH